MVIRKADMSTAAKLNFPQIEKLVKQIQDAESIFLSTHKQCDGDGLGAMLGLYHALKKTGKNVRAMTVDEVPKKYSFLNHEQYVDNHEENHSPINTTELALIFDTNDRRLVEPLYSDLDSHCKKILFVDHHPILNQGPEPTDGSFIDTGAASTGEIAFFLIEALGIRLDENIAQALYTSIAFDTQIFRYVKGSANSHIIAANLLQHLRNPESIHRALFATHTRQKVSYLGKVLSEVEYLQNDSIAILCLSKKDLDDHDLDMDDSRDVIDMVMNVTSVKAAALFREEEPGRFKMSLRSKGSIEILSIAENFNGGGHMFAAGAELLGDFEEIKAQVIDQLLQRIDHTK